MQWQKDDDGSLVSSPIYVAMGGPLLELMQSCRHRFLSAWDDSVPILGEAFKDCKPVSEKCQCGARRFRVTGPPEQINELYRT